MPYNYIPLCKCNLHFGLPVARRRGRICINSSTICQVENAQEKSRFPWKMQNRFGMFWLFLIFLGWNLHLFTLSHATQAAFSLSRRSAGQDRKNDGDVTGHKCPGMFDIAYWCVFCLRMQMQHTIHIMRAHNMPCHHSQDTHQQETTRAPPVDHPYTTRAPVLLCTTKLAPSTSQHYFVLRSLHKALPSTTLYYKACAKHVPVLLCTTKLAQCISQCYLY